MTTNENRSQLELPGILQKLGELLITEYGREHFNALEILHTPQQITSSLAEIDEMTGLINGGYAIPVTEVEDIRPFLEKLKPEDSFLEAGQISQIRNNLLTFEELTRFLSAHTNNCPSLLTHARGIHSHRELVNAINKVIDKQGEIREDASPELRRIGIEIQRLENEQKKILTRVLKRYSEFSQDDIVTLRDGRMVLGIQQQHINRVNGIVHGTSGSGATVFIEPMETLRLSNQIQNLKIEERKEIIRLLKSVSGKIRNVRQDIFYGINNFGYIDFVFAKSRLAISMQASSPEITEKPLLRLKNARHPLLLLKVGHSNVVPCDVSLGEKFTTLVITGPNAGGKTVALKTIGLLVLMTQMGLQIPADTDSIVPIPDLVLVDIGDRQSVEQDLSTFSAHILRLQDIYSRADTHTLVLIDEIGTGTDPREGAALAVAFLRELTVRKALTVATTHHGELKAFAFGEEGVENASMEFDLETLQPTYRLQVGIPGSSYAFEIAKRYGFSEMILERAGKILGPDKGQLENLIFKLNSRVQQIEKERRHLSIKLSEAEGISGLYQRQLKTLEKEKSELRQRAAEEAQKIVESANSKIEKIVSEIRQTQAKREVIRKAHKTVRDLKTDLKEILNEKKTTNKPVEQLSKGNIVWVEDLREEGELLEEVDQNQQVWVRINDLRIKLEANRLRKLEKKSVDSGRALKSSGALADKLETGVFPELDLRGMDSYQALESANRYLDRAVEEGWKEVRIIHGKGSGILRRAINQFLEKDKRVEEKRLGKWGEGDTGITVVKLKE